MPVCNEARDLLKAANRRRLADLGKMLERCESPVEQMLLVALFNRWGGEIHPELQRLQCSFIGDYPAYAGIFTACCELQRNVTIWQEKSYRVDFYIYLTRFGTQGATKENGFSPELVRLVVEVDGHDFHERTKLQASRDRERDRELLMANCQVVRFTGSDVFNDPNGCAEKIDEVLGKYAFDLMMNHQKNGTLAELIFES